MIEPDPHLIDVASHQDGVVALSQLTYAGIDRHHARNDVDAGRLTRLFRGVYAVDGHDPSLAQTLRAAYLHLGPESVVILRSALDVHGIAGPVGQALPQLAVPPGLEKRQRAGLDIHVWEIPEEDVWLWNEIPVTAPLRTIADCLRLLPRLQAVSCLDSALHRGVVTVDELPEVAALLRRKRHCVAARRRLGEARQGAESPLETRVRLRASDGGFAPDALQVPIHDEDGQLLGYGDMGYRLPGGRWLIVEADGRGVHELPEAVLHDRRRQNAFVASGIATVIRFTWVDTLRPDTIPSTVRAALEAVGRQRPGRP